MTTFYADMKIKFFKTKKSLVSFRRVHRYKRFFISFLSCGHFVIVVFLDMFYLLQFRCNFFGREGGTHITAGKRFNILI
jgi:hypothetical protein